MRVYLGSDHAGFELKNHLVEWLKEAGHEPIDCGPHVYDAQDDYPPFCLRAAERTAADPEALGVVIGGSGNGEQIAANKVKGVRAVLAWSEQTAALGREHNNANVISVGGRMHTREEMTKFIEVFLNTPYSNEERHTRRIEMLTAYEATGELPPSRPTTRSRADPAPLARRTGVQNSCGSQGATSQAKACDAAASAPGRSSRTSPARASAASVPPPR